MQGQGVASGLQAPFCQPSGTFWRVWQTRGASQARMDAFSPSLVKARACLGHAAIGHLDATLEQFCQRQLR